MSIVTFELVLSCLRKRDFARRLLWFLPPRTIQLHGQAQIVDWTDEEGTDVFGRFWMGRRILKAYRESHHVHGRLQHLATQEAHGIGSGQGRHPARVSVIGIFSLTGPPWGDIVHLVVGVPQQAEATACLSADHDGVW